MKSKEIFGGNVVLTLKILLENQGEFWSAYSFVFSSKFTNEPLNLSSYRDLFNPSVNRSLSILIKSFSRFPPKPPSGDHLFKQKRRGVF